MIRPLRIVALDLSTAATGVAATHDMAGNPRLSVRVLDTANRPLHAQTDIIEIHIRRTCGAPAGGGSVVASLKPDLVVIEGTFSRQSGSDYPLHHVRANVTQWLHRQRIPFKEDISPATLKVYATGSGSTRGENKVTKDKVKAAVIATYGRFLSIPNDDNACDAVALLAMGLDAYGQPLVGVPSSKRRALEGIDWPTLDLAGAR